MVRDLTGLWNTIHTTWLIPANLTQLMYDRYEVKFMEGASLPLLSPLQDSLPPSFPFGCQPDFAKFFALSIPGVFEAAKRVLRYVAQLRPGHFSVLPVIYDCRSEDYSTAIKSVEAGLVMHWVNTTR